MSRIDAIQGFASRIMSASAARAFRAPQTPDGGTTYTVKQGDSFQGIADAHLRHSGITPTYGQVVAYSEAIATANGVTTDALLLEGDTLELPPVAEPVPPQPAPVPVPLPTATPATVSAYGGVVNAADGIDDTEATYVFSENFETVDINDDGTASFEELEIYAAATDQASIEGQAASRIIDSRPDENGLYQQLDFGAHRGDRNDGHISAKDVANVLALTPLPPGLDAQGQAAFIESQLRAINRAVAQDGYSEGDAAGLVEIVMGNGALDNPAVANAIDLDTATTSAVLLSNKADDPAALAQMNNILLSGVERNHAANNDPSNDAAIRAMGGLFERYLDIADVGNDADKMAAAVEAYITGSGVAQSAVSSYSIGVFNGALVSGCLGHVEEVADSTNERNGLFRSLLTGASIGFALAAVGPAAPLAYTALSAGFSQLASEIPTADAQTGEVYDLAGQMLLGLETLDAPGDAARGMQAAINLGGHAS